MATSSANYFWELWYYLETSLHILFHKRMLKSVFFVTPVLFLRYDHKLWDKSVLYDVSLILVEINHIRLFSNAEEADNQV